MKSVTYKAAGVDIDKANALVKDYKRFAKSTATRGVISDIGSFGGLFRPDIKRFKDPILVSSTDGVGTKLKIAFLTDKHDTVGIDLVAMSANDILCSGAEGLFFLDYISTGKIKTSCLRDIVKGIARACREAGYALIGGETAEMPGMYKEGEYDLAGFCVGVVEKSRLIDGSNIKADDCLIGIESNGLHSNGFSLVRKVFSRKELIQYSGELLKPTRIYVKPILNLLRGMRDEGRGIIKGIAHITGGAFYDKIPRIIPQGLSVRIEKKSWPAPEIFKLIQKKGNVPERDMYRTLNMGIGMVLVVDKNWADKIILKLKNSGIRSWVIGEVIEGEERVKVV